MPRKNYMNKTGRVISEKVKKERFEKNFKIYQNVKKLIDQGFKRRDVYTLLNISSDKLRSICDQFGINFKHNAGVAHRKYDWPEEIPTILDLISQGEKKEDIAKIYNISFGHICKVIRRYCPPETWGCSHWTEEEKKLLKELYEQGEYKQDAIKVTGRKTGVSYAVQRYVNNSKSKKAINPISGEDCHLSKYTNDFVDKLRLDFIEGRYSSFGEISKAYNIPYQTAYNILTYKYYTRHLKVNQEKLKELREEMKEKIKIRKKIEKTKYKSGFH